MSPGPRRRSTNENRSSFRDDGDMAFVGEDTGKKTDFVRSKILMTTGYQFCNTKH